MSKSSSDTDIQLFEPTENHAAAPPSELVLATLSGFDDNGRPLVQYAIAGATAVPAITTQALQHGHIGRQVALLFVNQDTQQPIIIGLIKSQLDDLLDSLAVGEIEADINTDSRAGDGQPAMPIEQSVTVDGGKLTLEGKDEIVLKCGDSSITLTKSGKVLIRGKYLLNRSSGVNRIMGGSVQVN